MTSGNTMEAKVLDLKDLSRQRPLFALPNDGKRSIGYRFVPECSYARESHLFIFFPAMFIGPRFVEIQTFLPPRQRDPMTSPVYRKCDQCSCR